MHLRAGTLALLLSAAAAGADQPAAPLENAKKELKGLQQDQAAAKNATGAGRLADALPQYHGPSPGVTPLELPAAGKSATDLKKKKDAQKNWLADGVNKLEKDSRAKGKAADETRDDATTTDETENLDTSDPQYLLKVYGEQQKEAEARNKAKHAPAPANDAFAPFLQDWLGNSPSRGKFFDEITRRPESGGAAPAPVAGPRAGSEQFQPAVDSGTSARESAGGVKSNPYLQGLDMGAIADQRPNRPPAGGFGAPAKPPETAPAVRPVDPMPALRPAERKPLIPPVSDDKKYFPQQKKF